MTTLKPRDNTSLRSIRWRLRPGARAASWRPDRGLRPASCVRAAARPGATLAGWAGFYNLLIRQVWRSLQLASPLRP